MRESGILYPISSLPSRFGIGCFSREAFEFIDFCHEAGQGYWQILPIGPTGYGDSPYQPLSAFAGNPYFISPEELIEEELLSWEECESYDFGEDCERVDYGALYNNRYLLLQKAYERFLEKELDQEAAYREFLCSASDWLEDYCLYMALKRAHRGAGWLSWEAPLRNRQPQAIEKAREELEETIGFFRFQQYEFHRQWEKVHSYAARQQVKIIGDIPFYVSMDSADVWAHPEAFQMDETLRPKVVAGCPPDAFSSTGQLWGNPIYDWQALQKDGYSWWIRRIERSFELYDVLRIDHFHGFAQYYAVPYGEETAENGTMEKGPGIDFFKTLESKVGPLRSQDGMRIIAEDLGTVTRENQKLLQESGLPGMKILQYAYTSWDSVYMPFKYDRNCVVYTGTHDNNTTYAWLEEISEGERKFVRRYVNSMYSDHGGLVWDIIREAFRSVADLCIIPIQDYLVKGSEARMNCPGASAGNWQWRVVPHFLSEELADSIRDMTELYGRIPKNKEKNAEADTSDDSASNDKEEN